MLGGFDLGGGVDTHREWRVVGGGVVESGGLCGRGKMTGDYIPLRCCIPLQFGISRRGGVRPGSVLACRTSRQ